LTYQARSRSRRCTHPLRARAAADAAPAQESETLTGGNALNHFDTDFARIGLGICYDVRFPELAMVAARKGT
jgi:predicted amidohydrolase